MPPTAQGEEEWLGYHAAPGVVFSTAERRTPIREEIHSGLHPYAPSPASFRRSRLRS